MFKEFFHFAKAKSKTVRKKEKLFSSNAEFTNQKTFWNKALMSLKKQRRQCFA